MISSKPTSHACCAQLPDRTARGMCLSEGNHHLEVIDRSLLLLAIWNKICCVALCCAIHRLGTLLLTVIRTCRQWGAAVYEAGVCGTAPNDLGVAPVDSPSGVLPTYPEGTPQRLLDGLTFGGTGSGAPLSAGPQR